MQTLKELIQTIDQEIREKNIDNALDLLTPFENYDGEDWKLHYLSEKNEFQSTVLHQDDNFKLLLIYWSKSDKSKKHGHMKGGGLIQVLSGKIRETRFHPNNIDVVIGTYDYAKGDMSYIHDALAFHIVENQEELPAVSLHLYCTGTNSINKQQNRFETLNFAAWTCDYLDTEYLVPIMQRTTVDEGRMKGQSVDTFLIDYQEIDGFMIPYFMEVKIDR